jgi:hypothetical protein
MWIKNIEAMRVTTNQMMGGLFRLLNVTIVGHFYCLILLKLLHVSVLRPSSSRNILANTFLPEDGCTTETRSSLGSIK